MLNIDSEIIYWFLKDYFVMTDLIIIFHNFICETIYGSLHETIDITNYKII